MRQSQSIFSWLTAPLDDRRDPNVWRRDQDGSRIRWSDYGDRASIYGWEVDHIIPRSLFREPTAADSLYNIRALHWRSNVAKSDKFPVGLLPTLPRPTPSVLDRLFPTRQPNVSGRIDSILNDLLGH